HVVPSSMLCPPSVMITALHAPPGQSPLPFPGLHCPPSFEPPVQMPVMQLPPEVLLARMLLVTVRVPVFEMAPPLPGGALLPEKVQLVTVTVPSLKIAPPKFPALLSEKVQLVTVASLKKK